jgi:hypothetical protein
MVQVKQAEDTGAGMLRLYACAEAAGCARTETAKV